MAKQNLTVELFYSGDWHATPAYVRNPVRITRERRTGSEPTPFTATVTLQGIHNPKNPFSPLYGLAGQNTPIRIKLGSEVRFYGEVASWEPERTINYDATAGKGDAWTVVTANGILRRLGQGTDPFRTPLSRAMIGDTEGDFRAIAHWSMEDESEATSFGSSLSGQPAATITGEIDPAVYSGFPGSLPLPSLVNGSITAVMPTYTQTGIWQLQHTFMIPSTFSGDGDLVTIYMVPGNTVARAVLSYVHSGPNLRLTTYNAAGAVMDQDDRFVLWEYDTPYLAAWTDNVQGGDHLIRWSIWDATGSQITGITSVPDGPGAGTTGLPARVVATATAVTSNWSFGQVSLYTDDVLSAPSIGPNAQAAFGYAGETVADRLTRLCQEEGIPLTVEGSESEAMGVQPEETLLNLFAECERTDDGMLIEPRDSYGLVYRCGRERYNRTPALELDYAAYDVAPPLRPVLDDLASRNDVTVKRRNGSSATAALETGALSVQAPPNGIGRYTTKIDVNTATDDVLPHHARWHLHKGTIDGVRYASVTVDLVASPTLVADAESVDIGDIITIANLPADEHPGLARLFVLGYVEVIGSHTRTIRFNCIPAETFDVGVWGSDSKGSRFGAKNTFLAEDLTSSETAADVTATGETWITTASHPSRFPFNVDIGGLTYSCTAITGTTPNYTLTLVRLASDKAHSAGDAVTVTDTGRYGL